MGEIEGSSGPFTTERGEKLEVLRDRVEVVVTQFPDYWKAGPIKHQLYADILFGIIRGDIPTPPAE